MIYSVTNHHPDDFDTTLYFYDQPTPGLAYLYMRADGVWVRFEDGVTKKSIAVTPAMLARWVKKGSVWVVLP